MGAERCDRPGCSRLALHRPHHGGVVFPGWENLCCVHVDDFMTACAISCSDPVDAVTGLQSWEAAHTATCGAPEVPLPGDTEHG